MRTCKPFRDILCIILFTSYTSAVWSNTLAPYAPISRVGVLLGMVYSTHPKKMKMKFKFRYSVDSYNDSCRSFNLQTLHVGGHEELYLILASYMTFSVIWLSGLDFRFAKI